MSEETKEPTKTKLKAGSPLIGACPFCKGLYDDLATTNSELECGYPNCGKKFMVVELN